jgi:hypothetical protein
MNGYRDICGKNIVGINKLVGRLLLDTLKYSTDRGAVKIKRNPRLLRITNCIYP